MTTLHGESAPVLSPVGATSMGELLDAYPSARRALFQRYHIGGCNACGFQPTDTLAEVCRDHNIADVGEVIAHILGADQADRLVRIDVAGLKDWLGSDEPARFIDVRLPPEQAADPLPEAEPLDFADTARYLELPTETRIVFACQNGERSIDTAAFFRAKGFTNARVLTGGIDAWRAPINGAS